MEEEKYVCADNYGESNLIANRDSTGNWEHFLFYNNSDGTISIQSRANNKFLCAQTKLNYAAQYKI